MDQEYKSAEELLLEESFISWLRGEKTVATTLWDAWTKENPEHSALAAEAKTIFEQLIIIEKPNTEKQSYAENQLIQSIFPSSTRTLPFYKNKRLLGLAASFLLIGLTTFIYFISRPVVTKVQTLAGGYSSQILPDGSEVTLNAKSQIDYKKNWDKEKTREVWLKGEAYFHIKKTTNKSHFIVHTESCDIIVTGTKFNVVSGAIRTQVFLDEGSVTLQTKDGKKIIMQPGQFVEIMKNTIHELTPQREKTLAWKDHKLVFDNTPLSEAIDMINEQYDVHIVITDSALKNEPITGILPNNNLDVLLNTFEATMNFKIERKDDQIFITKP